VRKSHKKKMKYASWNYCSSSCIRLQYRYVIPLLCKARQLYFPSSLDVIMIDLLRLPVCADEYINSTLYNSDSISVLP
jgi:hypothetical protein